MYTHTHSHTHTHTNTHAHMSNRKNPDSVELDDLPIVFHRNLKEKPSYIIKGCKNKCVCACVRVGAASDVAVLFLFLFLLQ
jgi:hypothetical protein